MKKLSTFIVAMALGSVATFAQVLYSTNFATEEEFNRWTVIDNNGDGATWKYDASASVSPAFYNYSGSNAADDWFMSPTITPTKDGMVAVIYKVYGSSYGEKLEIKYGTAPTIEAMTKVGVDTINLSDTETGGHFVIDAKANESLNLGFHAVSDADKWRLYLMSVEVKEIENLIDLEVSEILSPITGEGLAHENVTIKIKNNGRSEATQFQVAFSVNGDTIATETINEPLAAGAEMEYTFTAKADLSTPRMGYEIKAWAIHSEDLNPANDSKQAKVVHSAPATVPYYMGFEELTDGIMIYNLNEDDGNWEVFSDPWWNMARTGYYSLSYNYDKNNNGDDWAILEPIQIEEAGYYAFKFWYSTDDSYPESFAVYYGADQKVESMTNKVVEHKSVANDAYKESITILYFDKPQVVCFGFYCFTPKNMNWINIDDVSFEKVSSENVDLAITELSNPTDYYRAQSKKNIEFKVRSLGIKDAPAKLTVLIDDVVASENDVTIAAQEIKDFAVTDILPTLAEGQHSIKVIVKSTEDENAANDTIATEFRVLGDAAYMWDFEDGVLPENFTFRAEDGGTVNSGAGAEFNEAGWGLFNIQQHEQFGQYMLAGTSWLDGTDQADRWCVLPRVKIASENAYLAWDASSFNANFLEDYSVKVSYGDDTAWDYWTEATIYAESPLFKTRGVDLSSYSGKEVYIAFQLKSKNCEALVLDNIALYGSFENLGVEDIVADDAQLNVTITDGQVAVDGDVISIALIDLSGRVAVQSAQNTLSTTNLNSGIYLLQVKTEAGSATKKIVVK